MQKCLSAIMGDLVKRMFFIVKLGKKKKKKSGLLTELRRGYFESRKPRFKK